jgi:hypothetical protein
MGQFELVLLHKNKTLIMTYLRMNMIYRDLIFNLKKNIYFTLFLPFFIDI